MTGYHDYLIVLSPPGNVCSEVKKMKDLSAGVVGEFDGRYSKAHITVQYWPRKKPVWIEPLIPKLERDLQLLSPVILDINGFSFFAHQFAPTIYVNINYTPLTEIWFKQLRRFFSRGEFIPHITIAKGVANADFKKLWPYFKNKPWTGQMKIDGLTILRREMIGHDKSYKVLREIPFNSRLDFYAFGNAKLKARALPLKKFDEKQIDLF